MSAELIDGNAIAAELKEQLEKDLVALREVGVLPGLATLQVGDDYAASAYERRVRRLAESLGFRYDATRLPADAGAADVLAAIGAFNADPRIHGVLALRPLGSVPDETAVFSTLDPAKDIEAVTPANAGLLAFGAPRFVPSTPASCFHLLDRYLEQSGRDKADFYEHSLIVVIGRSNNVGKPALLLGMARNATIISADVYTSRAGRLVDLTRQADVVVVAAGVAGLIGAEHVAPGAIVVDVGINPLVDPETGRTRMVGDVRFDEVGEIAAALTPVPGGVGPVTDVWLLRNTVAAARLAR